MSVNLSNKKSSLYILCINHSTNKLKLNYQFPGLAVRLSIKFICFHNLFNPSDVVGYFCINSEFILSSTAVSKTRHAKDRPSICFKYKSGKLFLKNLIFTPIIE